MDNQLLLLRDLVEARTGLFFQDYLGLEVIANRLKPRVEENGCGSFTEYHRFLSQVGESTEDEWLHVITALSRTKSSFLRHRNLGGLLARTIIPRFLLHSGTTRLRIWSAGCSTGEEPLTVAMALDEAGLFDRLDFEIKGSDANFAAIEQARRGLYGDSRMESLSAELRSKYFRRTNEGWQVIPELHKRIQWSLTNLMDESDIAELATSDIICCHNVFIYFSESAIHQTLLFFERQMPPRGYLFTDNGDYINSFISHLDIFERQEIPDASVWMKRVDASVRSR